MASLKIRYEDKDLIVIYKPVGVVVHPGEAHDGKTLVDDLLAYDKRIENVGQKDRPGIVHRLDKNTEGLMLIARTNEGYSGLIEAFKAHLVEKSYYAMCKGDIKSNTMSIRQPLGRHPKIFTKRSVRPDGQAAHTEIEVIKRYNTKTLVIAKPITGRTHQIRVHLAYMHHPILGDPLYGPNPKKDGVQKLQAFKLSVIHPIKKIKLTLEEPISIL